MSLGLPDGSILLHIGPHKTGTTAVQAALAAGREQLAAQGVLYPGRSNHAYAASMAAALGRVDPGRSYEQALARWQRTVRKLQTVRPRVGVLSSEAYSDADDAHIEGVLAQLGDETHVVVTLRPLTRIIASQWQQYVQNRYETDYGRWLRLILTPGTSEAGRFWAMHRHDVLIQRWVEHVGVDRLTVVVADEDDQEFLLRGFEELLGVRRGTLGLVQERRNRSLTQDEAELVRVFNRAYARAGYSAAAYTRFVRYRAVRALQAREPARAARRVQTPSWAVDGVLEVAREIVERIDALRLPRVIGRMESLADPASAPPTGGSEASGTLPIEAAGAFLGGLIDALSEGLPDRPVPSDDVLQEAVRRIELTTRTGAAEDGGQPRSPRR